MSGSFTSLLSLLAISTYICPTASYQISQIEKLQKTTCKTVYERALDNRSEIDFSKAVGNLSCGPVPNRLVKYQCMINEDGHNIQFCGEWIWIEPGLCPRLYSLQGIINPSDCDVEGCPTDKYQSHEYYKFPVCFEQKDIDNKEGPKETQKGNSSDVNLGLAVALPICLAAVVISVVIIAVFVIRKRRKYGTKYTTDTEQQRLLNVLKQERPLNAVKSKLDANTHVLVTGLPGSGTSTFLEHLKRKYQNWQKVKYKTLRFNKKQKGVVEIDHDIVKDLMSSDALNKLKDRILDAPGCAFIMSVKYDWYLEYAQEFQSKIGIQFDVIDLSNGEFKLNYEEKLAIVDTLCIDEGISPKQLSNEKRQDIASFDGRNCGFLQVLKELLEEEEFENPIKKMEEIDEQHKK